MVRHLPWETIGSNVLRAIARTYQLATIFGLFALLL